MPVYVALLRAINVGGTGMLPMKRLVALCEEFGLENARTYIQHRGQAGGDDGRVGPAGEADTAWIGPGSAL